MKLQTLPMDTDDFSRDQLLAMKASLEKNEKRLLAEREKRAEEVKNAKARYDAALQEEMDCRDDIIAVLKAASEAA